jgi:hypothetical protein
MTGHGEKGLPSVRREVTIGHQLGYQTVEQPSSMLHDQRLCFPSVRDGLSLMCLPSFGSLTTMSSPIDVFALYRGLPTLG